MAPVDRSLNLGGRAVLAGAAGIFGSLDTALNIAFPDLVDDFGLTVGDLQWVVVCFVLTYGGLLLAAGQLGDAIGHRRVLSIGAGVSTVAVLACAVAPTFALLLVARVIQGVGTAMVLATAPALVTTGAGEARGRAIGVFQTAAAIGLAVGPVVGGPLVELAGWRGVFWFRVPIGLLLFALSLRAGEAHEAPGARPDRIGAFLGALTLGGAVLALNLGPSFGWFHPVVVAATLATLASGLGFVRAGRVTKNPVLDLQLFRSGEFALANLLAVLANGAMFATWLLVPALLIDNLGASLLAGGLVLAASPLLTALVAPVAGRISDRYGPWLLITIGLALEAAGMLGLSMADADWSLLGVAALMAVTGAGLAMFSVPNMSVVMGAIADSKQGVAGGLSLMTRTIGIVVGVAVSSALFDGLEPDRGFVSAFSAVFVVNGIALVAAAAIAATQLAAPRS